MTEFIFKIIYRYTSIELVVEILLERNKGTVSEKFKAILKPFLSRKCTVFFFFNLTKNYSIIFELANTSRGNDRLWKLGIALKQAPLLFTISFSKLEIACVFSLNL